jgi:hypothetical protein
MWLVLDDCVTVLGAQSELAGFVDFALKFVGQRRTSGSAGEVGNHWAASAPRDLSTNPLSFQLRRNVHQTGYLNNVFKEED